MQLRIPNDFPAQGRLETVSAADAIYQLLRGMIIEGQLAPGMRLREVEMAERLGVSRTPLREALARLSGDRLVRKGRGGVEVADTLSELVGIRHIRMALEGYATRLAAAKIQESELEALDALAKLSASLPYEAMQARIAANTEFHGRIYRACEVPQLIAAIENYAEYFMSADELKQLNREEASKTIVEHAQIIEALRNRDGARAEELMRSHLLFAFNKSIGKKT